MRKYCSKVIVENFFEPCILYLLMKKPGYGYEIKADLDDKCCCSVNIANLYRNLSKMEKQGHLKKKSQTSKIGPDKKVYEITASGKKLLAEWIAELEAQSIIINKLISNYKKL